MGQLRVLIPADSITELEILEAFHPI